ncbi:MAG: DotU family type VI secretion system protein [Pseudomonadota bacterium]
MSSPDDPFAPSDSDHTIIMPSPGGRSAPPRTVSPVENSSSSSSEPAPQVAGMNSLIAAANPLLVIVPQLRGTLQHPDPAGLRDQLVQNIKTFESRAKAAGVAAEKVIAARYALCTLLDEVAASTPWGGSGSWARHSLLVFFHNETWGGEKFYQLLSKLAENPTANRDLLELMYVCLALGFEGRYRVIDNGRTQLETLRERLAQIIRKTQGEYERDLSPRWRGTVLPRSKVFSALPLWVAAAVCGVIMVGAYLAFNYSINNISDPVFAQIQAIRVTAPVVPAVTPIAVAKPRLATFLQKEIQEGLVAVRDDSDKSVVTIRGDGLFPPGSTAISANYMPLIARIGEALNAVQGHVQITGHTDNQPIRSARFPSNWHLSQERARSVMQLLAVKVPAGRLSADGRADAESVAPNDTAENRARNRRVEITLFVANKTP